LTAKQQLATTRKMEYIHYRYMHGQQESSLVRLLSSNMDVFSMILENETISRKPVLVYIDKYYWRDFQSWMTGVDYKGRRRGMVSALSCTCKMLQNTVQFYMNPCKLTILTRTILRSNADYKLWCQQRLTICESIVDVPSKGKKRSREQYDYDNEYLLDYEDDSDSHCTFDSQTFEYESADE